jgi:hypothetical protein
VSNYKVSTAAIATGASVSDPINTIEYPKVGLEIPTFSVYCETAACAIRIEASSTSTTSTFRPIYHMGVYSAGSGLLAWEVPQGNGNYVVTCEPGAYLKWMRVRLQTNTTTAAMGIGVHLYANP